MTQINFQDIEPLFTPLSIDSMIEHWSRLHGGDRESLPETNVGLQAWLLFHNGRYLDAAELAAQDPTLLTLRLKALSTYAYYLETDTATRLDRLQTVIAEANTALEQGVEENPNVHYQKAYSQGRYGQLISIAKALAEGLAGQIETSLKRCLALSPEHADAHTAYATYQAELIAKLGKMAARLTYGVSRDDALVHYQQALELAPRSVSAKTEFADGLLLMGGKKQLEPAIALYEQAVATPPIDALEAMDYWLANQELNDQ